MSEIKVEYIDHMGNDLSVVNAARVSFAKESELVWDEANEDWGLKDADRRLVDFLAREKHELPFSHTAITLRMKAPIPQRTQCFKSKVGFVENEESRRYISCEPELFIPEFREAVQDKKQGSGGTHRYNETWKIHYTQKCKEAIRDYKLMIGDNICPEQARYILPQGVMVNWIWTGSLLAYARFYGLRSKPDTQKETQEIAKLVGGIMSELYPISWQALTSR